MNNRVGQNRTYIRIYGVYLWYFKQITTIHMAINGVYIRFWPTLQTKHPPPTTVLLPSVLLLLLSDDVLALAGDDEADVCCWAVVMALAFTGNTISTSTSRRPEARSRDWTCS